MRNRTAFLIALGSLCVWLSGCNSAQTGLEPTIQFTKLPPAGQGSPDKLHPIEGRVVGVLPGQKVVLYARSGIWWIQPTTTQALTTVQSDLTWKNVTHPGSAYAALIVNPGFNPPVTAERLPQRGGNVAAVAVAEGAMLTQPVRKTIVFSGYEWEARQVASDRGGTRNLYDPANAWTDENGLLHLRISKTKEDWASAEISLSRSLGYGSYRFVVRDISHLEPAAVLSIFTWDDAGPPREMDIEVSRWGELTGRNAQYVIQPYYIPANTVRFMVPAGTMTHSLVWEPGRVSFRTVRGPSIETGTLVDEHTFSSGVPSPGNETIHMNLYRFGNQANPLRRGCEVVIEKFEYLP